MAEFKILDPKARCLKDYAEPFMNYLLEDKKNVPRRSYHNNQTTNDETVKIKIFDFSTRKSDEIVKIQRFLLEDPDTVYIEFDETIFPEGKLEEIIRQLNNLGQVIEPTLQKS